MDGWCICRCLLLGGEMLGLEGRSDEEWRKDYKIVQNCVFFRPYSNSPSSAHLYLILHVAIQHVGNAMYQRAIRVGRQSRRGHTRKRIRWSNPITHDWFLLQPRCQDIQGHYEEEGLHSR